MTGKKEAAKATVQKVEVTRAKPQTSQYVAPTPTDRAVLHNLETGKRTVMSRQYAERRARKAPNKYRVI